VLNAEGAVEQRQVLHGQRTFQEKDALSLACTYVTFDDQRVGGEHRVIVAKE
jgi:hypothetical protein